MAQNGWDFWDFKRDQGKAILSGEESARNWTWDHGAGEPVYETAGDMPQGEALQMLPYPAGGAAWSPGSPQVDFGQALDSVQNALQQAAPVGGAGAAFGYAPAAPVLTPMTPFDWRMGSEDWQWGDPNNPTPLGPLDRAAPDVVRANPDATTMLRPDTTPPAQEPAQPELRGDIPLMSDEPGEARAGAQPQTSPSQGPAPQERSADVLQALFEKDAGASASGTPYRDMGRFENVSEADYQRVLQQLQGMSTDGSYAAVRGQDGTMTAWLPGRDAVQQQTQAALAAMDDWDQAQQSIAQGRLQELKIEAAKTQVGLKQLESQRNALGRQVDLYQGQLKDIEQRQRAVQQKRDRFARQTGEGSKYTQYAESEMQKTERERMAVETTLAEVQGQRDMIDAQLRAERELFNSTLGPQARQQRVVTEIEAETAQREETLRQAIDKKLMVDAASGDPNAQALKELSDRLRRARYTRKYYEDQFVGLTESRENVPEMSDQDWQTYQAAVQQEAQGYREQMRLLGGQNTQQGGMGQGPPPDAPEWDNLTAQQLAVLQRKGITTQEQYEQRILGR